MKKFIATTVILSTLLAVAIAQRKHIYNFWVKSPGSSAALPNRTHKSIDVLSNESTKSHLNNSQSLPEQAIIFDLTRFDISSREGLPFDSTNASKFFTVTDRDPYGIRTTLKGFDQRAKIVKHPSLEERSALKIELPKGKSGTAETGVTAKIPMEINSNRVYLDFSFSFLGLDKKSDSLPQMGKLIGLCIAECTTGQQPSDGTNGASARISYRKHRANKMALFGYLYHLEQKFKHGTYFPGPFQKAEEALQDLHITGAADSNYPTIKLGDEHINHVRMYVDLNTPDRADGEVKIYLNGRLASHAKKLVFRKSSKDKFSGLAFDIFHGGGADYRLPIEASILLYNVAVVPL